MITPLVGAAQEETPVIIRIGLRKDHPATFLQSLTLILRTASESPIEVNQSYHVEYGDNHTLTSPVD